MEDQRSSTDGKQVGFWVPGVKRSGNSQDGKESRYKEVKSPFSIHSLRKTKKNYQANARKCVLSALKNVFLGLRAQLTGLTDNLRLWLPWNTSHSTAENGLCEQLVAEMDVKKSNKSSSIKSIVFELKC